MAAKRLTRSEIAAECSRVYLAVLSEWRADPSSAPSVKERQNIEARQRALAAMRQRRNLLESANQDVASS